MISTSESRAWEIGLGEQLEDALGKLRIPELNRRDVDRDLQMLRPVACFVQAPASSRSSRAPRSSPMPSATSMNRIRFEKAVRRLPSCEHFETDQLTSLEVDLRLIVGNELAGGDRAREFRLRGECARSARCSIALVEPHLPITSGALGRVHRDVRSAKAFLGGHAALDP